jgi:hypothetical protein
VLTACPELVEGLIAELDLTRSVPETPFLKKVNENLNYEILNI